MHLRKYKIAVIGAGKLAHSLTDALIKNDFSIDIIISRNQGSAYELAHKFKIKKFSHTINDIPASTNIFLLTVPDDQIKAAANHLSKLDLSFKESIFIHFSGAKNISALKSLRNNKSHTASFHIMQTFPSKRIVKMNGCFATIETESSAAKKFLLELAARLELHIFSLNSNQKANYHLAGVFASNFLISNIFSSELLLNQIKKRKNALEILDPIIRSTLKNVKSKGTKEALSGPIIRGDLETIKTHLIFLKKFVSFKNRLSNNFLYLSYLIQSLSLTEIVRTKVGKLNFKQMQIEKFLLKELKNSVKLL